MLLTLAVSCAPDQNFLASFPLVQGHDFNWFFDDYSVGNAVVKPGVDKAKPTEPVAATEHDGVFQERWVVEGAVVLIAEEHSGGRGDGAEKREEDEGVHFLIFLLEVAESWAERMFQCFRT